MKTSRKFGSTLLFILTRIGVAIGILLLLFSIAFYLFVPQSTPVSLKLSSFEKIVLPQSDNCATMRQSVVDGSLNGTPPLKIENELTLVDNLNLTPKVKTFRAYIQFYNVILKIQDMTDQKAVDLGVFPISRLVEFSGELTSLSSAFISATTPATRSYYCDPMLTIPGDYSDYYLGPEAETVIVDSSLELNDSAFVQVSGDLDVSTLGLHTSSKELLFIVEFPPNALHGSYYRSGFSVWADQISPGSEIPYAVADYKEWPYKTIPKYKMEGDARHLEIYAPKGVLKIGNDSDIPLDSPTTNSTQSLIFSPSIFNKTSTFHFKADTITGQMEIYGDASSIILNGKEIGKVPWSALPQYIQTGFFGLLITCLATLLARSNKLFIFFKPPKTGSIFTPGQFVCETRSGYIISGKLKRSPAKGFPYYEIEQAHRKLRSNDEWEPQIISSLRISSADVEQTYEV